jgi:hypothetical protein
MKRTNLMAAGAALVLLTGSLALRGALRPAHAEHADDGPALAKKIVPILTFGSSLNVGAAQVQGEQADVDKVKAVAQIETDYKDVARIKILVPIQTEKIVQHIDRVPGVSVSALADYALRR